MSGLSNLTQLVLHDGLRYVYSLAFIDCRSLQQLWIDDVASWCEIDFEETYANPMMYADELYIAGERLYGQLVVPETVTEIKAYAFYGYEGRYATLPRSLQKVGRMAFSFTSLEKIYYYGSIDQWQLVDLDPTALGEGTQVPVYYYSAYQPTEEGGVTSGTEHPTDILPNGKKTATCLPTAILRKCELQHGQNADYSKPRASKYKSRCENICFFSGQVAKEKHIGKVASNANVDKWTG